MVCHIKTLVPLLLVAGCCYSVSSRAETDTPAVKLGSSWYKAAFETRFPPQGASLPPANGSAVLYKNKADLAGEAHTDIYKPIAKELRTALAAPRTANPFRTQFPDLYTAANLAKRDDCAMISVPVEVDDKSATKEWVVAFSATQCLDADPSAVLRAGDSTPHQWVLQKTAAGKYRVLAEGDGQVYITNHQKEQGYKEIRTNLLIKRILPDNALQCGGAEFTWRYRNNGYALADTDIMAQDCEPLYFPELTGEAWQKAYDKYAARVKTLVEQWLKDQSLAAP